MAPSSGYHMVPKAVRAVKYAISRSSDFVRARLAPGSKPSLEAVPVHVRVASQPIHPIALIRQSRSRLSSHQTRLFSTAIAQLGRLATRTTSPTARGAFPASATRAALSRSTHAPFASPLRPNLTGGALPRTAGGYGLGSGGFGAARHFSHTGSAQAHVVQNVHAAVRAFVLQGSRPLYDGTDSRTGNMRFRAVGHAEATTYETLKTHKRNSPWEEIRGTSLDFHLAPAITALSAGNGPAALDESTVLPTLASDFARQLRELSAMYMDLKKLRTLGALPISHPDETTIRVRFDGCDADAVLALCNELGVTRGIVKEDPGWEAAAEAECDTSNAVRHNRDVEMALLFPWAPTEHCPSEDSSFYDDGYDDDHDHRGVGRARYFTDRPPPPPHRKTPLDAATTLEWRSMMSSPEPLPEESPAASPSYAFIDEEASSEPFESVAASSASQDHHPDGFPTHGSHAPLGNEGFEGYEGVEGIYRFLRELESADRRA